MARSKKVSVRGTHLFSCGYFKRELFFELAFHRLGAKAEARGYLILSWAQSFLGWGKQTMHLDIGKLIVEQPSRLKTILDGCFTV